MSSENGGKEEQKHEKRQISENKEKMTPEFGKEEKVNENKKTKKSDKNEKAE